MPANSKTHYGEVEYVEWENEYYLKFPDELMTELDWAEGDMIEWELIDDKTVLIRRIEE